MGSAPWSIERAEVEGGLLRVSGMAFATPGVIGEAAWFVLLLGDTPVIDYWGDRVLIRRDDTPPAPFA